MATQPKQEPTPALDPKKVEILFKDEPRTLAQGLTD